jgi:(p)ppGpp synthase/HD superfamily hydrolase
MLGRAIAIAAQVHAKQTDRGGKAYILHPIRVMMRLRTDDEELMCIAILHDCVEDSNGEVTVDSLRFDGFSERVVTGVETLSHREGESYEEYIRRIAVRRDLIKVKKEDLRDNGDITRLKGLRDKDFERMQKYHRAFAFLCKAEASMDEVGY